MCYYKILIHLELKYQKIKIMKTKMKKKLSYVIILINNKTLY